MKRFISEDIAFNDDDTLGDVYSSSARPNINSNGLTCLPIPKTLRVVSRRDPLPTSAQNCQGPSQQLLLETLRNKFEIPSSKSVRLIAPEPCKAQPRPKHKSRKIPGPAGLLPPLGPGQSFTSVDLQSIYEKDARLQSSSAVVESSQSQDITNPFNTSSWKNLQRDLCGSDVLKKYNIEWTKNMASKDLLVASRVPLLCVLLNKMTICGDTATATFLDTTGEMVGIIHRQVTEDRTLPLHEGATLVLQKPTVWSFSSHCHYLAVMRRNVVCVYTDTEADPSTSDALNKALAELDSSPPKTVQTSTPKGLSDIRSALESSTQEVKLEDIEGMLDDDDWMSTLDLAMCDSQIIL